MQTCFKSIIINMINYLIISSYLKNSLNAHEFNKRKDIIKKKFQFYFDSRKS